MCTCFVHLQIKRLVNDVIFATGCVAHSVPFTGRTLDQVMMKEMSVYRAKYSLNEVLS